MTTETPHAMNTNWLQSARSCIVRPLAGLSLIETAGAFTGLLVLVGVTLNPSITLASEADNFQCDQLSPALTELGDGYYRLEKSTLVDKETPSGKTDDLLSDLQAISTREGSGMRIECFGSGEKRTEFVLEYVRTQTRLNGNWVISAYEGADKTLRSRHIELPTADEWEPNGDILLARHITRHGTGDSFTDDTGSYLAELLFAVADHGRYISVSQTLYVDGFAAEQVHWQFDR